MKANKKGISLIVLVITIVVIIILAATVILSLSKNNPIDNARIANLAQTQDSIYSAIYSYDGSVEAKTEGYFTKEQILFGTAAADDKSSDPIMKAGTADFAITTGEDLTLKKADGTSTATVRIIDPTKFSTNAGEALPTAPIAKTHWAVDKNGQVYLVFDADAEIPTWMGKDKDEIKSNASLANLILFKEA